MRSNNTILFDGWELKVTPKEKKTMRLVLYHKLFRPINNSSSCCSSSSLTTDTSEAAKLIFNHVVRMRNNAARDSSSDDDDRRFGESGGSCSNGGYHWKNGFDITLQQLQAVCEAFKNEEEYDTFTPKPMTGKVDPSFHCHNPTTATAASAATTTRLVVRLNPFSADDVACQLNSLSELLDETENLFPSPSSSSSDESNNDNNNNNNNIITPIFDLDMVVIHRPPLLLQHPNNNLSSLRDNKKTMMNPSSLTTDIVEYLYQVLPYGAKFLENHPFVGHYKKHGQCNAHGNPMDQHVIGVCHDLGLKLPQKSSLNDNNNILSDVVDMLPPTRLSIRINDYSSSPKINNDDEEEGKEEEIEDAVDLGWEAIQQSTDHLDIMDFIFEDYDDRLLTNNIKINDEEDGNHIIQLQKQQIEFCKQVWDWQYQIANAKETYVSCSNESIARKVIGLYQHHYG